MMTFKKFAAFSTICALTLSLMSGCGQETLPEGKSLNSKSIGSILLSLNPEIEIEYDKDGRVIEVEGLNDDGKKIAEAFIDIEGEDCYVAVSEIAKKIYDDGYFDKQINGHAKNIVLKLENGSETPDDDFLEDIVSQVNTVTADCGIESKTMLVDEDDFDDNGLIGLEKAKELVLSQLAFSEAQFTDKEYKLDDEVYELEFVVDGVEYEFEVDAVTGKVLEADFEHNDDWNDNDDDDSDDVDDDSNDVDDDDSDDVDDNDDDDDSDDAKKPVSSKKPAVDDDDDDDKKSVSSKKPAVDDDDDDKKPVSSKKPAVDDDDNDDDDNSDDVDDNDDDDDNDDVDNDDDDDDDVDNDNDDDDN